MPPTATQLRPANDEGTRRAAMRAARPYRRTALAITIASFAMLFDVRGWLGLIPANLVALIVIRVGRRRARAATGIDPGGGRAGEAAKNVVVTGGVMGIALIVGGAVAAMFFVGMISAVASMFDGCLGGGSP